MKRKIISINEEECNGCGICVDACHEGALQLVNGKARLVSESYCDGLGACLPECPTGAMRIEERDAAEFDEEAVKKQMAVKTVPPKKLACGCPGTQSKTIRHNNPPVTAARPLACDESVSELQQWPCQIKLVPVKAPYLENARLLVAADCTAYAYANIHRDFIRGRITLVGCPKLDDVNYAEKLAEIMKAHEIKDITVLRMEVPCCGGIVQAVKQAMTASGKVIPWQVVTISVDGRIIEG